MRWQGNKEDIEAIEFEIKRNAFSMVRTKNNLDNLFGIKSLVDTKVYDVLPTKQAVLIPVRIFFDNRDGIATLDVRDRDIKWFIGISSKLKELVGKLTPQRND
jgi:hypothetical protein